MSLFRAYLPPPWPEDASVLSLTDEATHHLQRVMRVPPGEVVELFDGTGNWARGLYRLGTDSKTNSSSTKGSAQTPSPTNTPSIEVAEAGYHPPPPCRLHLGLGISERERMDYAVQKSSELGVAIFTPLASQHGPWQLSGARAERRLEHWRAIAIQAVRQSNGYWVPEIRPPQSVSDWAGSAEIQSAERRVLLDTQPQHSLTLQTESVGSAALAIGPKGGWSEQEIKLFAQANFASLQLGPRVLRTETAPVAALALLQWFWGDWN